MCIYPTTTIINFIRVLHKQKPESGKLEISEQTKLGGRLTMSKTLKEGRKGSRPAKVEELFFCFWNKYLL